MTWHTYNKIQLVFSILTIFFCVLMWVYIIDESPRVFPAGVGCLGFAFITWISPKRKK